MAKKRKGTWEVRVKATVTKLVRCEDCTEEQAERNPYDHSTDEMEIEQTDYEVLDVRQVD